MSHADVQELLERRERLLGPGNPLFYDEGTMMFFADAKEALEQTLSALDNV